MTRVASIAAIVGVVQFVATWAILGATRSGYDPTRQAISELAELGASTRTAMTTALVVFALLQALFAWALRHRLAWGAAVATAVLANAVGTLGVAVFPCTRGCPGPAVGGTDSWHILAAGVSYAGLILAPLLAWAGLRRARVHPALQRVSSSIGFSPCSRWRCG